MPNESAKQLRRDKHGSRMVWQGSGHQAAAYIRGLIFDGELAPGAKVPQGEIARELGISRIPVREALVALEKEGRVTIQLHRGAFVAPLTEDSVLEAMEFVGLISDYLVRRAAERATPKLLDHLRAVQADIDETDDPRAMWQLHHEWLDLITEAGSAPRVARAVSGLWDLITDNHYAVVPGAFDVTQKGTRVVTKAIVRHDPVGAARAYAAMSRSANRCVIEFFRTKGTFAASDNNADYIDDLRRNPDHAKALLSEVD